jgi:hypothetical protein
MLFATIGHQPCSGCGAEVKQPLQGKHKLVTVLKLKKKVLALHRQLKKEK